MSSMISLVRAYTLDAVLGRSSFKGGGFCGSPYTVQELENTICDTTFHSLRHYSFPFFLAYCNSFKVISKKMVSKPLRNNTLERLHNIHNINCCHASILHSYKAKKTTLRSIGLQEHIHSLLFLRYSYHFAIMLGHYFHQVSGANNIIFIVHHWLLHAFTNCLQTSEMNHSIIPIKKKHKI